MKEGEEDDFEVNPYSVTSANNKEINYDKLIQKFGCSHLTPDLVERIEKLTGKKPHYYLTRGIFFSHRELDLILNAYENNKYSLSQVDTPLYQDSIYIQVAVLPQKPSIWGTCYPSSSASICSKFLMYLLSSKSLTMKNTSTKTVEI